MALLLISATLEELLALFPKSSQSKLGELDFFQPKQAPSHLFSTKEPVFLSLSGPGPVNAAIATAYALRDLQAKGHENIQVLLTGLAGSYDLGKVPLLSLCEVELEIWPEYGLNEGHTVIAEAFKWPLWQKSPTEKVYDRISLNPLTSLGLKPEKLQERFIHCQALTVAGTSASFERAQNLKDRYRAELENMEGFAVAYTCARFNIPCCEIRCVSNKTGPRRPEEKDFPGALVKLEEILPLLQLI